MPFSRSRVWIVLLLALGAGVSLAALAQSALAGAAPRPAAQAAVMHPAFPLLDAAGANVLLSRQPLSTGQTCGACHDTGFITTHSFHADLGFSERQPAGQVPDGQPWDTSPGLYGRWDPLTYRYLSPAGDQRIDLTPLTWLKLNGARIVGGGPAEAAAGVEMNCFLCHFTNPNNAERAAALERGDFAWANTAVLAGTGIVSQAGDAYAFNANAFTADGDLQRAYITLQDPSNDNCAQCHGLVHTTPDPLTTAGRDLTQWQTAATGQIVSAQKISLSGMNIAGKTELARAWDLHAERGLQCVDCHYSLNNPVLAQTNAKTQPDDIVFDPRRLDISQYLQKPSHQFARGQSAQYRVAADLKGTMRRCESCHAAAATHAWLPYTAQHLAVVACETCHIPQLHAPAVQSVDWTVLTAAAGPVLEWRGVDGDSATLTDLITGYTPVLLPRLGIDGQTTIAPYNLVTAWYWLYDDPAGPRPARLADLQAAYFAEGAYRPAVVQALDTNGDGTLAGAELRLDTPAKQAAIAGLLQATGLTNPRLAGQVQPYSINHTVVRGDAALRECTTCHSDQSRLTQAFPLSTGGPAGVTAAVAQTANTVLAGTLTADGAGLAYQPTTAPLYQLGHDRVVWIDWFGSLAVLGVLAGVSAHGGLRFLAALKRKPAAVPLKRVYMYSVYERFWHWFQTFAILLLVFTGLVIHRPDLFGLFSFAQMVVMHNVLAVILTLNAALSLFYHLVSGEIQHYLPRPYGFFDQAIVQAKYYLRGIFRHERHPFEKTRAQKLNPLQQITYFGILNFLLPLQIITGALMLGVQSFPQIAGWLGGLPFLAPFHSLVAWTFAAFIIAHVYLTTTGHAPLANLQAMMVGWDEVEDFAAAEDAAPAAPAAQPAAGD